MLFSAVVADTRKTCRFRRGAVPGLLTCFMIDGCHALYMMVKVCVFSSRPVCYNLAYLKVIIWINRIHNLNSGKM